MLNAKSNQHIEPYLLAAISCSIKQMAVNTQQ